MSAAPSWYLNGVSLASLGFRPLPTEPGRRSGLSFVHQGLELPGLAGELDAGIPPKAPPRTITIDGVVRAADRAAVLEAIRVLCAHASRGEVELRCVDAADRVIRAVRTGDAPASVDAPSLAPAQRDGRVTLRFRAAEPAWRDTVPQVLAIGQTATPLPLGYSLASPWTLELFGSEAGTVTDPTIHYEDAAGNAIATLGLTGTLNWATDATARWWLSTEGYALRIRRMVAGAWQDDHGALTTGTAFALDPQHGWPPGGQYSTLRLSDGASRATGLLRYTRRHEA